ncbi:MAG: MBL fold metallo-hydrolase [Oscillospiraceae bacterium]|nr:MBL fold metallo-hydrolase [Oscillospiraceae bacterium]
MDNSGYEAVKIGEGSWRIEDNGVRALLFAGSEKALLVDTGFGNGNIRPVVESLTQLPVTLVNTHADGDHTGCNARFGLAHMHPSEFSFYFAGAAPGSKVAPLWDGDEIDIGGRRFEAIHIPGHTPGSIALLDRANRILVAGDSVSATPIFLFSEVRSLQALELSLLKLDSMKGAFDEIYPAHGPFPLKPDVLGKLAAGARRVLNGEVEGKDTPPDFPIPAQIYDAGDGAMFLWNGIG